MSVLTALKVRLIFLPSHPCRVVNVQLRIREIAGENLERRFS